MTRREGGGWEGRQRRGKVEIFAAGGATRSVLGHPSDDLSVLLDESFFRGVVVERMGVDPDRVALRDRYAAEDLRFERLLLSFLPELATGGLGGEVNVESLATALTVQLVRDHPSLGIRAARTVSREPEGGLPGASSASLRTMSRRPWPEGSRLPRWRTWRRFRPGTSSASSRPRPTSLPTRTSSGRGSNARKSS